MDIAKYVIGLIMIGTLSSPHLAAGQAAHLTVGEKIIYGGGPDQPPKEKDTGVSLKVNNLRGSDGPQTTGSDPAGQTPVPDGAGSQASPDAITTNDPGSTDDDKYTVLLLTGRADEILTAVEGRDDLRALAWQALAQSSLGRTDEARDNATRALTMNEQCDDDTRLPARLVNRLRVLAPAQPAPRSP